MASTLAQTQTVRSLRGGQLAIPAEFRRRLSISDGALLQLTLRENKIEVMPVTTPPATSMAWAQELYAMFAPVRQEARTMDEAEIDALIDAAVDAVRLSSDD